MIVNALRIPFFQRKVEKYQVFLWIFKNQNLKKSFLQKIIFFLNLIDGSYGCFQKFIHHSEKT